MYRDFQEVSATAMPVASVEKPALDGIAKFVGDGAGYFCEEGTHPQTVGYALSDSPFGQAI